MTTPRLSFSRHSLNGGPPDTFLLASFASHIESKTAVTQASSRVDAGGGLTTCDARCRNQMSKIIPDIPAEFSWSVNVCHTSSLCVRDVTHQHHKTLPLLSARWRLGQQNQRIPNIFFRICRSNIILLISVILTVLWWYFHLVITHLTDMRVDTFLCIKLASSSYVLISSVMYFK